MTSRLDWLLWDADGVLQHSALSGTGSSWRTVLDAAGGPGFADAVFAEELPALRGEEPLREALKRTLRAWPHAAIEVDELLELWRAVRVDDEAFELVARVRATGVRCALATLGVPAAAVGFIDDDADNIAAAQALGIPAVRHDPASGVAGLRCALAQLLPGWGQPGS